MARPLRIIIPDGWYHVMGRGIERRDIFHDGRDYGHFLELLEAVTERYGIKIHAYALMPNHYHLAVQTPHANLSQAIWWLNVSYSVWFNVKHGRVGHVFQGRFKSVSVEEGAWAFSLCDYIHLNPIRVHALGLSRKEKAVHKRLFEDAPTAEQGKVRLAKLKAHKWSSYSVYAGYRQKPAWLVTEDILRRVPEAAGDGYLGYRRHIQRLVRGGEEVVLMERFLDGVVFGTTEFAERLKKLVHGDEVDQPEIRAWKRLLSFERVVEAVESVRGDRWCDFATRYGDFGRDMVFWLAHTHCGLTLKQIGAKGGCVAYPAVGFGVRQFGKRVRNDSEVRRQVDEVEKILNLKT
jgi:REP element-mobilizing transposase RayT